MIPVLTACERTIAEMQRIARTVLLALPQLLQPDTCINVLEGFQVRACKLSFRLMLTSGTVGLWLLVRVPPRSGASKPVDIVCHRA